MVAFDVLTMAPYSRWQGQKTKPVTCTTLGKMIIDISKSQMARYGRESIVFVRLNNNDINRNVDNAA